MKNTVWKTPFGTLWCWAMIWGGGNFVQNVRGEENVLENAPSLRPEKISGPLHNDFWHAQSWIFVHEKQSNDIQGGWKGYQTKGGSQFLLGRGVLREVFLCAHPTASFEEDLACQKLVDFPDFAWQPAEIRTPRIFANCRPSGADATLAALSAVLSVSQGCCNYPPIRALSHPIPDRTVALILALGGGGGVALPPARGVVGSLRLSKLCRAGLEGAYSDWRPDLVNKSAELTPLT